MIVGNDRTTLLAPNKMTRRVGEGILFCRSSTHSTSQLQPRALASMRSRALDPSPSPPAIPIELNRLKIPIRQESEHQGNVEIVVQQPISRHEHRRSRRELQRQHHTITL